MVDCQVILDPPMPENYFGNCVIPLVISMKNSDLSPRVPIALRSLSWASLNKRAVGVVLGPKKLLGPSSNLNWTVT
ncbi:hypothetical protein RJ641_015402 [Dillenia turbinata]|uniref:Uncharacterized protein n=1 Tax=Dillenia turbinata TaxID=194707 RepID=A0AAN8V165_9MAGN